MILVFFCRSKSELEREASLHSLLANEVSFVVLDAIELLVQVSRTRVNLKLISPELWVQIYNTVVNIPCLFPHM